MKAKGYVIHEGTINGHAFVVIATMKTRNAKTGDMVQIWFLLRDVRPTHAVRSGLDAETICRGCPFASGNGCYVTVHQAPLMVWKAYHRGIYSRLEPKDYADVFSGRKIRFGAYGNPSLLPVSMVKAIASVSEGWTGYFHDWKTNRYSAEYAKYFMASTETVSSFAEVKRLGFRTFTVTPQQPSGTLECLSETKGLTCEKCKLCAGLSKARQPSIWINPHGANSAKASAMAMAN